MPGYLPEEKIQSTLDAADIFVLPYLHGIGSSASGPLLRAMASGLPIVASDVGAFSEEIDDGSNGRLVSPGDPIALAKAIKALVEDGAKRSRFGAEARASVLRRHDRRIVAEQFAGIYAEAMQRRRS
jgi:glycosyltransferase involved in cell wall biosynthesis